MNKQLALYNKHRENTVKNEKDNAIMTQRKLRKLEIRVLYIT